MPWMVGLHQLRNNKSFIKKDFAICMFFRNISLQMCRQNASSVFFFYSKNSFRQRKSEFKLDFTIDKI